VAHADPVVVAVDASASDLIELLQLLAADLADLPVRHINLTVIAENHNHRSSDATAEGMKLSGEVYAPVRRQGPSDHRLYINLNPMKDKWIHRFVKED